MSRPTDEEWASKYYSQLKGAIITDVAMAAEGDGLWPQLKMKLAGYDEVFTVEVSSDEEGNNPGFLHGLPWPDYQNREMSDGS